MNPIRVFVIFFCAGCIWFSGSLSAQDNASVSTDATKKTQPGDVVAIAGIVTESNKYSIKVKQGGVEYVIRFREKTAVGLKLKKPWFDWANGQVVVDSIPVAGLEVAKSDTNVARPRVAFKLPSEKLFLISKLRDAGHVKHFLASSPKRVSYYLVTPENVGQHMPTLAEQYVAGKIVVDKQQRVSLQVGSEKMQVKLGFRNATMNGFSISDLKAGATQVVLSGLLNSDNSILATSIVFEPVHKEPKSATATKSKKALPAKR